MSLGVEARGRERESLVDGLAVSLRLSQSVTLQAAALRWEMALSPFRVRQG